MQIYAYCNSQGIDLINKYIESLTKEEQVDAYDVLKQLEDGRLDTLHIRKWNKKIYEVYFYKHNRIFFIMLEKRKIYLLHACRKQKNKTEKKDCKIVLKRAKEIL